MKRLISGILLLTLLLSCTACSENAEQTEIASGETASSESTAPTSNQEKESKEDNIKPNETTGSVEKRKPYC